MHFDVSREKSIKAIEKAMVTNQKVFLITQKDPETEEPAQEDLYRIGTIAEIKQLVKTKKNLIQVLVEGEKRGELFKDLMRILCIWKLKLLFLRKKEEEPEGNVREAMLRGIKELFRPLL